MISDRFTSQAKRILVHLTMCHAVLGVARYVLLSVQQITQQEMLSAFQLVTTLSHPFSITNSLSVDLQRLAQGILRQNTAITCCLRLRHKRHNRGKRRGMQRKQQISHSPHLTSASLKASCESQSHCKSQEEKHQAPIFMSSTQLLHDWLDQQPPHSCSVTTSSSLVNFNCN